MSEISGRRVATHTEALLLCDCGKTKWKRLAKADLNESQVRAYFKRVYDS